MFQHVLLAMSLVLIVNHERKHIKVQWNWKKWKKKSKQYIVRSLIKHVSMNQVKKDCTYEFPEKLASTPSDGIGPTRKLVDTLLQNNELEYNNK